MGLRHWGESCGKGARALIAQGGFLEVMFLGKPTRESSDILRPEDAASVNVQMASIEFTQQHPNQDATKKHSTVLDDTGKLAATVGLVRTKPRHAAKHSWQGYILKQISGLGDVCDYWGRFVAMMPPR